MEEVKNSINYACNPELVNSRINYMCEVLNLSHDEVCDMTNKDWMPSKNKSNLPPCQMGITEENDGDQLIMISLGPEVKCSEAEVLQAIEDELEHLYEDSPCDIKKTIQIKKQKLNVHIYSAHPGSVPVELGPSGRESFVLTREYVGHIKVTLC